MAAGSQVLPHAPAELTQGRLRRLGEGVGKVVYASDHWVVKRERSPFEVVALIVLWKMLRRIESHLPGGMRLRVLDRPSKQLRLLRVILQATMVLLPKTIWMSTHVRSLWRVYHVRSRRGQRLAEAHLDGSDLAPERIEFPPVRVKVSGWPGELIVDEATERLEETLDRRLARLARAGQSAQVELWLERLLTCRQRGWQTGLFSMDAHLNNFGVAGDRVLLIDHGGLTNRWMDVEKHLAELRAIRQPHLYLGLGPVLGERTDLVERFNARWRETVSEENVRKLWPQREVGFKAAHSSS